MILTFEKIVQARSFSLCAGTLGLFLPNKSTKLFSLSSRRTKGQLSAGKCLMMN